MTLLAVGSVLLSALIHAGWNMLVRHQRTTDLFLSISILTTALGLAPALLLEIISQPVLPLVWVNVILSGALLGCYYYSLTRGYQSGNFTVVYPLARAIPVLLLALSDLVRGNAPTLIGWLGIAFVSMGSALLPLESLRELKIARYWNRTSVWILLAAFATAGYSIVDSAAAQIMPTGLEMALRYNVLESFTAFVAYAIILLAFRQNLRGNINRSNWRIAVLATLFVFGGYSLVLLAFQVSSHASYVIGLRQISIVIGVIAGALLFHEPAARLRVGAAVIITLGVIFISLAR